jgi:hypothetical protein
MQFVQAIRTCDDSMPCHRNAIDMQYTGWYLFDLQLGHTASPFRRVLAQCLCPHAFVRVRFDNV